MSWAFFLLFPCGELCHGHHTHWRTRPISDSLSLTLQMLPHAQPWITRLLCAKYLGTSMPFASLIVSRRAHATNPNKDRPADHHRHSNTRSSSKDEDSVRFSRNRPTKQNSTNRLRSKKLLLLLLLLCFSVFTVFMIAFLQNRRQTEQNLSRVRQGRFSSPNHEKQSPQTQPDASSDAEALLREYTDLARWQHKATWWWFS